MINIKRVLVPTDFSEFSDMALAYGCEIARRFDAELHLLHIVENVYPLVPEGGGLLPSAQRYLNDLKATAKRDLEQLPKDLAADLTVHREVVTGVPFVEIIRYAREHEIDMIVVGTHGRTGLKHVFMGSVAEAISRQSTCPVLVTRLKGHQFVMP